MFACKLDIQASPKGGALCLKRKKGLGSQMPTVHYGMQKELTSIYWEIEQFDFLFSFWGVF